MSTDTPVKDDLAVWRRSAEAHSSYLDASRQFFAQGVDRVALMRAALREGKDIITACHLLEHLDVSERESLFDLLVEWASTGHGLVQVFRKVILSMPRDWVRSRIEKAAESYLRQGTYDEYRRFLELYLELDRDLCLALAHRAREHPDPDIREAGDDFVEAVEARKAAEKPKIEILTEEGKVTHKEAS